VLHRVENLDSVEGDPSRRESKMDEANVEEGRKGKTLNKEISKLRKVFNDRTQG